MEVGYGLKLAFFFVIVITISNIIYTSDYTPSNMIIEVPASTDVWAIINFLIGLPGQLFTAVESGFSQLSNTPEGRLLSYILLFIIILSLIPLFVKIAEVIAIALPL